MNEITKPGHILHAGALRPASIARGNFCFVGTPGAGKTNLIRQAAYSVALGFTPGRDERAVFFDPKADLVAELRGVGVRCPIHVLNPFDARAAPWDMAKDLRTPAATLQFAKAFTPDRNEGESGQFFVGAAQRLIVAGVNVLNDSAPGRWTLRDFVELVSMPDRFLRVMAGSRHGRHVAAQFGQTNTTFANVLQTLGNDADLLRPVAAIWHRSRRAPISLREWVTASGRPSILTLGGTSAYADTLEVLNRMMFGFLTKLVTSEPERPEENRFWFFIDELAEAGRMGHVAELLRLGRAKGARVMLGFGNLPDVVSMYGRDVAEGIIGQIRNFSFLALACEQTAAWASRHIGQFEAEMHVPTVSQTIDPYGNVSYQEGYSVQRLVDYAVKPSDLMNLPPVSNAGIPGYHKIPELGISAGYACVPTMFYQGPRDQDFVELADPDDQVLLGWDEEDGRRLGLPAGVVASLPSPDEDAMPMTETPERRTLPEPHRSKRFRRDRSD